jgi:hypothetical protein
MTDLNWPSQTLPEPASSRGRWERPRRALVAWLGALCAAGAAWVSAVANGPLLFELLAVAVAMIACLVFGAQIGYRRDGRLFGTAIMGEAVVVVLSAAAAWFTMFFVPVPGGSAGVLEIIGLPLIIVIAGTPLMVAITTVLGLAALLGLALGKVRS